MMCNEQELPWSDNALITKSRNMLLLFGNLLIGSNHGFSQMRKNTAGTIRLY